METDQVEPVGGLLENGEWRMEGQRRGSEPGDATWDELYMTDPCPGWRDVTISVSSCATGWNGNSYLPRCPSVSRPEAGHLLGVRLGRWLPQ